MSMALYVVGRTREGLGEEGSHTLDVALLAKVKGMRLEAPHTQWQSRSTLDSKGAQIATIVRR